MIPIRDDNPHFLTPYATYAIVGLNVLAWAWLQGFGFEPGLSRSVCTLGLVPGELLQSVAPGTQVQLGPEVYCTVTDTPAWISLFTHMFLHGSWMHIIGNMWFLWIFGDNVEESLGRLRYLAYYLLTGLCAAGLQVASAPTSVMPMVGASGAISGILAGYVLLHPRARIVTLVPLVIFFTTFEIPAFWFIFIWFGLQLLNGLVSLQSLSQDGGVAWWAHVGGFVFGMIAITMLRRQARRSEAWVED